MSVMPKPACHPCAHKGCAQRLTLTRWVNGSPFVACLLSQHVIQHRHSASAVRGHRSACMHVEPWLAAALSMSPHLLKHATEVVPILHT